MMRIVSLYKTGCLLTALLTFSLIVSNVEAQTEPEEMRREEDSADAQNSPISYASAKIGYQWHDSLQVVSSPLYFELSRNQTLVRFGIEFVPIGLMHTPSLKQNWYVSSNLIFLLAWGPPYLLSQQIWGDSSLASYIVGGLFSPLLLPSARPRLSIWPADWASIWVSYDAQCVLFAVEDGVWFRPEVGIEIRPRSVVGFEIAAIHNNFWSWESNSRSFGWGIHGAITFDILRINQMD